MRHFWHFIVLGAITAGLQAGPLDYQVYKTESNIYYVLKTGVLVYSHTTRDFRTLIIDEAAQSDEILDVAQSDNFLWILSSAGVYMLDMTSKTVEKIPFLWEKTCGGGKLAADLDYVWLACPDTLKQFEQLGREWLAYPISNKTSDEGPVLKAQSNGNEVYLVFSNGTRVFYISDEKWKNYELVKGKIGPESKYVTDENNLFLVDNKDIFRFRIESRSWETISSDDVIIDAMLDKRADKLYYLTKSNGYSFKLSSSISQKFDTKIKSEFSAFDKLSDSVCIAAKDNIVLYGDLSKTTDFLPPNDKSSGEEIEKVSVIGEIILFFTRHKIHLYFYKEKIWQSVFRSKVGGGESFITWNDDGMKVRYSRGYSSTLKGYVDQVIDASGTAVDVYDIDNAGKRIDTSRGIDWDIKRQDLRANLTLHNQFPEGRYMDVTFSNIRPKDPPVKGMQYRGSQSDWLQDATLGANTFHLKNSKTMPDARFQGVSGVFESKTKLQNRDRKKYRVTTGTGLFNSRTVKKVIPYNSMRIYSLLSDDIVRVVPGSVRILINGSPLSRTQWLVDYANSTISFSNGYHVWNDNDKITIQYQVQTIIDNFKSIQILREEFNYSGNRHTINKRIVRIIPGTLELVVDGEELKPEYYTFVPNTGGLNITREAGLDPSSIIMVSYEVETIPEEGIKELEILPENNYGAMGYINAQANYTDWLSSRITYVPSVRNKGEAELTPYQLAQISLPVELRRKNLFLEITPEYTRDAQNNTNAGGLGLLARLGKKTTLGFDGLMADTGLVSTDNIATGFGVIKNEMKYNASYDIFPNWVLSYNQSNTNASRGENHRFEAVSDVHIPKFPFLNISISRNLMDAEIQTDSLDTLQSGGSYVVYKSDTLDIRKDRIKAKLYETSSPYLEKNLHFNKIGYEFAHTEYFTKDFSENNSGRGRIFFNELILSPVKSITFSGLNNYNKNPAGSKYDEQIYSSWQLQTIDAPPGLEIGGGYKTGYDRRLLDKDFLSIEKSISLIMKPGNWWSSLGWFSPRGSIFHTTAQEFTEHAGYQRIVFGVRDPKIYSVSKTIGAHIFPTEDIFFENKNTFEESVEAMGANKKRAFKTLNDLKLWFNSKRSHLQTRWEMTASMDSAGADSAFNHIAQLRFDNIWRPWLSSKQGMEGSFFDGVKMQYMYDPVSGVTKSALKDTSDLRIGPKFTVSLNFQDISIIKKLVNNHDMGYKWRYVNGKLYSGIPEITYTQFLRAGFKPNLFLIFRVNVVWSHKGENMGLEMAALGSQLSLQAYF